MTKSKTQSNINTAGKKRRFKSAAQKESLKKAQLARTMRAAIIRAQHNPEPVIFEGQMSITRHSVIPQPISKVAEKFLQETVDYCLERLKKHKERKKIPLLPDLACHHHITVGSSHLKRLLDGTLELEKLHNRAFYKGAQGHGAYWEDKVALWDHFTYNNQRFQILSRVKTPTGLSYRYPWLVATPDFIMKIKSSQGVEFTGVVEVKSTESPRTFNSNMNEYVAQVRAALEVFNLDVGFMVVFLVDNTDKFVYNEKIVRVNRNNLFDDSEYLLERYSHLVHGVMYKALNLTIPKDIIINRLRPMTNIFPLPVSVEEAYVKLPNYADCLLLKAKSKSKHLTKRTRETLVAMPLVAQDEYDEGGYYYKRGSKNAFASLNKKT